MLHLLQSDSGILDWVIGTVDQAKKVAAERSEHTIVIAAFSDRNRARATYLTLAGLN